MAAPKGNSFWKLAVKKPGRKRVFESPSVLKNAALEYFESVDANPFTEEKVFCSQGEIITHEVKKKRPYTVKGMCIFFRIDETTWHVYKKREEFFGVIGIIESIIYTQKFEGATCGFFKDNIIARDLGLTDKTEVHQTSVIASVSDPIEEMKRRGIPVPDINIEDIKDE